MKDIRMEDIIEKVKAMNPNLPENKIRAIIKEGCKNIVLETKRRNDIRIQAMKKGLVFQVYKPHSNKNYPNRE